MDINAKLAILSLAESLTAACAASPTTKPVTPDAAAKAIDVIYNKMVDLIEPSEK